MPSTSKSASTPGSSIQIVLMELKFWEPAPVATETLLSDPMLERGQIGHFQTTWTMQ